MQSMVRMRVKRKMTTMKSCMQLPELVNCHRNRSCHCAVSCTSEGVLAGHEGQTSTLIGLGIASEWMAAVSPGVNFEQITMDFHHVQNRNCCDCPCHELARRESAGCIRNNRHQYLIIILMVNYRAFLGAIKCTSTTEGLNHSCVFQVFSACFHVEDDWFGNKGAMQNSDVDR